MGYIHLALHLYKTDIGFNTLVFQQLSGLFDIA